MNPITFVYHEILFRPLFNLLVGITNMLPGHTVGIAIILVTIVVRILLLPSSLHQAKQMQRNQKKMADLQSELKKVKERFQNDKVKQAEATMALYRKAGINPAAGLLPLLVQFPILIALYRVFLVGMGPETWVYLYSFVAAPATVSLMFLSYNLTQPSLVFGVVAGIGQLIQMRSFSPTAQPMGSDDNSAKMVASMQKNMMYIFPVMTVFIAWKLPAALALYWIASTVMGMLQQHLFKRFLHTTTVPTM